MNVMWNKSLQSCPQIQLALTRPNRGHDDLLFALQTRMSSSTSATEEGTVSRGNDVQHQPHFQAIHQVWSHQTFWIVLKLNTIYIDVFSRCLSLQPQMPGTFLERNGGKEYFPLRVMQADTHPAVEFINFEHRLRSLNNNVPLPKCHFEVKLFYRHAHEILTR